jgi:periplasmic protein TonB
VKRPRLRGLTVSIALHVAVVVLVLVLLWEGAEPPALFIDLTRPLEEPATARGDASPAPPAPAPAASTARRGQATRDRPRQGMAPAPSAIAEPPAAPAAQLPAAPPAAAPRLATPPPAALPPAESAVAASPPAPAEIPVSPSPVLAPPAGPASAPPAAVASPSLAPSASAGSALEAFVDSAGGGSETVSTSTSSGMGPSAPAPSSSGTGTGTGRDMTGSDQRGQGTTALAVPRDGGRAGADYAEYLALVRRRIQESLRYPVAARRRGLTGRVHVEITVEPSGRIAAASLVASSGHPLLDEAALDAVRTLPRVPFPPHVTPRSLRVRLPVVFELH